jgi:hypothetical protein
MSCKPGSIKTFLGKTFDHCCGLRIENPDSEALKHTKKLIEKNKI